MGKMNVSNNALLALFAEMVWDDAIRKYKEQNLYKEIDLALAKGINRPSLLLHLSLKRCNLQDNDRGGSHNRDERHVKTLHMSFC